MSDDRNIPVGIRIFWTIFGLFLLGLVGSFYPRFGAAFSFLISILSALGGAIAAVAAYFTVSQLRQDKEDERKHRRPYFTTGQSEMGVSQITDDEEADHILIRCHQVGINPAAEVKATIDIIEADDLRLMAI